MDSFFITLREKKQLTHDVYELIYSCPEIFSCLPGQFLLCETDQKNPKLRRSYSISDYMEGTIHFIIKELPNGKGGSKAICNQEIGHTMQVWGPMGNFVLPAITEEKIIFIGTGTGFAPLYFQAKTILEHIPEASMFFLFGVREEKDLFYHDIFLEWSKRYPHFSYQFCLSQAPETDYFHGRVTDYLQNSSDTILHQENIFSICGSPAMVREVRDIFSRRNIPQENIFFEQY